MPPEPQEPIDADYRRTGWRATARSFGKAAVILAAWAPGVAFGFWLTRRATSETYALLIALVCGWLWFMSLKGLRVLIGWPPAPEDREPDARLLRSDVDGQPALAAPPEMGARRGYFLLLAQIQALVVFCTTMALQLLEVLVPDFFPAGSGRYLLLGGYVAVGLAGVAAHSLAWLPGPVVAMFADRLEVRRGFGRYAVGWHDIAGVADRDGRVEVTVARPDAVATKGWTRRPRRNTFRLTAADIPAGVLAGAMEHFRRLEPDTRRSSLPFAPLQVVDEVRR